MNMDKYQSSKGNSVVPRPLEEPLGAGNRVANDWAGWQVAGAPCRVRDGGL